MLGSFKTKNIILVLIFVLIIGILVSEHVFSIESTDTRSDNTLLQSVDTTSNKDISFKDIKYRVTSAGLNFEGTLQNNALGIEGSSIKLFCNSVELTNTFSKQDGSFEMITNCPSGREVYAQAEYNGKIIQSTHIIVPHGMFGYRTLNNKQEPAGVPEFSAVTLISTVAVVLLALLYLRKK